MNNQVMTVTNHSSLLKGQEKNVEANVEQQEEKLSVQLKQQQHVSSPEDYGESSSNEEEDLHEETCFQGEYCLQLTPAGGVVKCHVVQAGIQDEVLLTKETSPTKDPATRSDALQKTDSLRVLPYDSPRSMVALKKGKRSKKKNKRKRRRHKHKSRFAEPEEEAQQGPTFCLQLTNEGDVAICEPIAETSLVINDENTEITDPTCFLDNTDRKRSTQQQPKATPPRQRPQDRQLRNKDAFCLQLTPHGEVVKCASKKKSNHGQQEPLLLSDENHHALKRNIMDELILDSPLQEHTGTASSPEEELCLQLSPIGQVVKRRSFSFDNHVGPRSTPSPQSDGSMNHPWTTLQQQDATSTVVTPSPVHSPPRQQTGGFSTPTRNIVKTLPNGGRTSPFLTIRHEQARMKEILKTPVKKKKLPVSPSKSSSPMMRHNKPPSPMKVDTPTSQSSLDFELQSSDGEATEQMDTSEEEEDLFQDTTYMQLTPNGDVIQCSDSAGHPVFVQELGQAINRKPLVQRLFQARR